MKTILGTQDIKGLLRFVALHEVAMVLNLSLHNRWVAEIFRYQFPNYLGLGAGCTCLLVMLPYLGPEMIEFLLEWCCPRRQQPRTTPEPPSAQEAGAPGTELATRNRFATNVLYVQTPRKTSRTKGDDPFIT